MKSSNKKARFLHEENRHYRGQRRANSLKKIARRVERRTTKKVDE